MGDGKISNENYLDINNEIVNIRKNNIQAQQSLSLVKEQLHSEFLNDKDYETNEIDNNKLVVNSKASLPDILNPMLLKENKDDGEVCKIIAEPIYEEIATDEIVFNSQITAEQVVVSNKQQQLDSKNNVISSDEQKEADDKEQVNINKENLQVKQPQCSYVAPSELEYDDVKHPLMSNSSETGNGEYGSGKQLFTNEYYQGQQYSQVQEQIVALGEQKEADDTNIEPNKIYYHSPMTGKTVEIDPQKTRKFLFANLPEKPDELESPVYEYNPIEEQDKKPKQGKKKNHESRSYGIFDQTMQRQANPVGIQEAVSYPQGYVQARYQTKSNYYKQTELNINLPNQETYNKSVINQQFDTAVIAEHYHSQYPNYIFTNGSCPICYQGG
ncbi:hypothetical protein [Spiroplasma endosymbiont of 'Nebria riversi']|uniref:hypothetical protein n=1 Tax=Spiroplasma endosymbiont of 'Nebria riversi' TaxID=2792084 RepID=UPI001C0597D5|nr:hypothetical protein [Spiroplasma endosymbiont of 'Nebria riversi']